MERFAAILSWVGRVSAQASLLVLLILALQWILRSRLTASWRYALWWVVVLRLVLPLVPESTLSIFNYAKFRNMGSAGNPLRPIYPDRLNPFASSSDHGGFSPSGPPKRLDIAVVQLSTSGVSYLADAGSTPLESLAGAHTIRPLYGWMFGIWLGGVIFLGSRLAWGNYLFSLRLKDRPSIMEPAVLALLEECRRVIGTQTRLTLIESEDVDSPALFGCFDLKLLLPRGMARNFSLIELRHVFLHELAHVKRRDVLANWFVSVLQTLHWFNPVLWFAFARMRADRELACDALVLSKVSEGENQSYGETLIKLLDTFGRPKPLAALVGIMEAKTGIKKRISMIATFRKPSKLSALAVVVLVGLGLVTLTDAESEKKESAKGDAKLGKAQLAADQVSELAESSEAEPGSIDLNERDKAKIAEQVNQSVSTADLIKEGRLLPRDPFPMTDPSGNIYWISTNKGAQIIRSKLDRILLQETPAFEGVPLSDVVKYLRDESVKRDPDKRGVNFIINTHVDSAPPTSAVTIDPNTGLPFPSPPVEQVDLPQATVRVPAFRDIRLVDLVDAISKSCDQPIKYSVEEYAVVFSRKTAVQLFTRTFKVNPNAFLQGLTNLVTVPSPKETASNIESAGTGQASSTSTNTTLSISDKVRRFFEAAGVSFSPPSRNAVC
jgi:beta-lactamase regulating signal transducer with metallopeptidase domain